jgi:ABC-type uncharacterized transport system auxiliary subunit
MIKIIIHNGWILLLVVIGLTACSSQPPVPEDRFYHLPAVLPDETNAPPFIKGVLGVERLRSDGVHGERAILYIEKHTPLELKRYHYHFWTNSPTALVQEGLRYYLRAAGVADKTVLYGPGNQADVVVRGRLLHFERLLNKDGPMVFVHLELETSGVNGKPSWNREYSVQVKATGGSMHDTVATFGKALKQIFDVYLEDLKKNSLK